MDVLIWTSCLGYWVYVFNFLAQILAGTIETLAWAFEQTPLENLIQWRDKPVVLSILQARLVGLAHFSIGYIFTYALFLLPLHQENALNLVIYFYVLDQQEFHSFSFDG